MFVIRDVFRRTSVYRVVFSRPITFVRICFKWALF